MCDKIEIEILDDIDLAQEKPKLCTSLYMTKYEYSRIVGRRALQIYAGAPPEIEIDGMVDPIEIAKEELRQRKTPLSVVRKLPSGIIETIDIKDMNIRDY